MRKIKYLAFAFFAVIATSSCDFLIDDEAGDDDETEIVDGGNNGGNTSPDENPSVNIDGWSAEEIAKASTVANVAGINQVDKDIIMYCNLARMDGARFWSTIAKPYLGNKQGGYISSLKSDLEAVKGCDMLKPEKGLFSAAKYHAEDMSKNNYFAHQSFDGTDTFERVARFYTKSGYRAENIAAGYSQALDIVMQWLVDENTPNLGHRKTILSNQYKVVGVHTCKHPGWRWVSVQDFGSIAIDPLQ